MDIKLKNAYLLFSSSFMAEKKITSLEIWFYVATYTMNVKRNMLMTYHQ